LLLSIFGFSAPAQAASFPNAGFEDGTFTGWEKGAQTGTLGATITGNGTGVTIFTGSRTFTHGSHGAMGDPSSAYYAAPVAAGSWTFGPNNASKAVALQPVGQITFSDAMTALGLYATLYKYSDAKNVLVFDDCDSVFQDDLSLNILKAALDSGKRRRICWNSDSALLRREGIPDQFDFKGSAIFITNLKFENVKSKKLQDHLEALESRCHFLDLTIDTERDKMLRIKQVHRDTDGGLFRSYDFDGDQAEQIMEFMSTNKNKLRELSLRMCLKIADLVKISPNNWQNLAASTCMKR
jgi:hypothetical protein